MMIVLHKNAGAMMVEEYGEKGAQFLTGDGDGGGGDGWRWNLRKQDPQRVCEREREKRGC